MSKIHRQAASLHCLALPYFLSFFILLLTPRLRSVGPDVSKSRKGLGHLSRRRADGSRQVAPKNEKENQAGLSPWQIRSTHVHRSPRQEDGGWPTTAFPARTRATVALLSFGHGGFPRVSAMEGASPSTEILRSWEDLCRLGMSCFNVMYCLRGGLVLFCFLGAGQNKLARVQKVFFGSTTQPRNASLMRGCRGTFCGLSTTSLSQKDEFLEWGGIGCYWWA
jgi:hypothetical protein